MVFVVSSIGAVIYGLSYLLVTNDIKGKQVVDIVMTDNVTVKETFLPVNQGRPWEEIDDPAKDGWDTEVLADQAKKQLKEFGGILSNLDVKNLSMLIKDSFACDRLLPAELITIIDDKYLKIERAESVVNLPDLGEQVLEEAGILKLNHLGADGLAEAIRILCAPFENEVDLNFTAKVFRVIKTPNGFLTRQYVRISSNKPAEAKTPGKMELHTTWDIAWESGRESEYPRMRWIQVVEFEQTESHQPDGALFADCTKSVLGGNPVYAEQFLHGMNHWLQRIQAPGKDVLSGYSGFAVADVNGDGLEDLYVCQEAGLPNRLFIQQEDGSAREESAEWGVDWLQSSRSALLVDLDNDSDQDMVLAIMGGVVLMENDGQGKFIIREILDAGNNVLSLSAVDYDLDGRLDIYACVYRKDFELTSSIGNSLASSAGFILHDASNGGSNVLYKNRTTLTDGWRFLDITKEVGLDVNNHRFSMAASWDDFDNDGDQDLYVSNDYGRDHLYRNDSPGAAGGETRRKFVDISDAAHIEDSATGMSTSWADYDRDGWMDVFIANMWSSAGNRITFQEQFKSGATAEAKRRYQRVARGNTLLRNQGDGTFADHSAPAGIEMGRWAWGTNFVDLNNDGWEDIFVANGFISTEDTGDL
ncbi:MAG: hypothetical protein ACI9E1_001966 [Cryomorphaceae bacterium]|jgi:hypothetical protein